MSLLSRICGTDILLPLHFYNTFLFITKPSTMKKKILMYGMLALLIAGCRKGVEQSKEPEKEIQHNQEDGQIAVNTTAAASIDVYPVRGLHNTGYDRSLDGGSRASWNCNREYSNSDFVAGDHLGIDIWAAEGTPVAARSEEHT